MLIPGEGVSRDEAGDFVLVVKNDKVERRSVRLGGPDGLRMRVLTGLANGERIVASLDIEELEELKRGATVTVIR